MELTHVFRNLGLLTATCLMGLLLFILINEEENLQSREEINKAASIELGADLYEIHCRTCHGNRGEGVGQSGPALADKFFFKKRLKEVGWQGTLRSYVYASSAQGRIIATRPKYAGSSITAVMTPWLDRFGGPLREDQLNNITDFILNWEDTALGKVTLKKLEIPQTKLDSPEAIVAGKKLFAANCLECHRVPDLEAPQKAGPDLSHIATIASTRKEGLKAEDYIRESFLIPSEVIVEGFDPDKTGLNCGGILTQRQLDEITAYLLTLD